MHTQSYFQNFFNLFIIKSKLIKGVKLLFSANLTSDSALCPAQSCERPGQKPVTNVYHIPKYLKIENGHMGYKANIHSRHLLYHDS